MIGINVAIPVPVGYHSFKGWKNSIFADLWNAQPRRRVVLYKIKNNNKPLAIWHSKRHYLFFTNRRNVK